MRFLYALCVSLGFVFLAAAIGIHNQTNALLGSTVDLYDYGTSTVRMVEGDGTCVFLGSLASSTATLLCGSTKSQLETLLNDYTASQRLLGKGDKLDARAKALAKAIAQHETGHRNVPGATGELATRYQFMPATWKTLAKKYLGSATAPTTDTNQDKVAVARIKDLLKQGYSETQVAMVWNGGKPYRRAGTVKTKAGKLIKYDTAAYATKVLAIYEGR